MENPKESGISHRDGIHIYILIKKKHKLSPFCLILGHKITGKLSEWKFCNFFTRNVKLPLNLIGNLVCDLKIRDIYW